MGALKKKVLCKQKQGGCGIKARVVSFVFFTWEAGQLLLKDAPVSNGGGSQAARNWSFLSTLGVHMLWLFQDIPSPPPHSVSLSQRSPLLIWTQQVPRTHCKKQTTKITGKINNKRLSAESRMTGCLYQVRSEKSVGDSFTLTQSHVSSPWDCLLIFGCSGSSWLLASFSLVTASRGGCSLWSAAFSLRGPSLVSEPGIQSTGWVAVAARAQLLRGRPGGSSQTGEETRAPASASRLVSPGPPGESQKGHSE